MSKPVDYFKPEFFRTQTPELSEFTYETKEHLAKLVNDELKRIIEAAPVVYGISDGATFNFSAPNGARNRAKGHEDTHQARLFCIKEIVKEPCKHEPGIVSINIKDQQYTPPLNGTYQIGSNISLSGIPESNCKHCGVELQARWEIKETK